MKNMKLALVCAVFLSCIFSCGHALAQRYVNSAEDAARAAKQRLSEQRSRSSSQIEWLDNVINTVNMRDPAEKDTASINNKAIEESR